MSRAQSVRLAFNIVGLVLCLLLFFLLPFGAWIDFLIGAAAWLVLGGIGERCFRRSASPEEIRTDLEERKDAAG